MDIFPKEKTKIKARIRRYERALLAEEAKFGGFMDRSGKRYLLGPLYLLADDTDGALKAFQWFEQKFPDDSGEPFHYLCWTLALLKCGDIESAKRKALETVLCNQYVIPILLGRNVKLFEMRHSSNDEEPAWINEGPVELFELWDAENSAWLAEVYDSPEFARIRNRQVEIYRLLETEFDVSKRKVLIDEAYKLREHDF